jgi:hypothetical protein
MEGPNYLIIIVIYLLLNLLTGFATAIIVKFGLRYVLDKFNLKILMRKWLLLPFLIPIILLLILVAVNFLLNTGLNSPLVFLISTALTGIVIGYIAIRITLSHFRRMLK